MRQSEALRAVREYARRGYECRIEDLCSLGSEKRVVAVHPGTGKELAWESLREARIALYSVPILK